MKKRIVGSFILVAVLLLGGIGIQQSTTSKEDKVVLTEKNFTENQDEKTDDYRIYLEKKYESLLEETNGFEQIKVAVDVDGDSVYAIKVQIPECEEQEKLSETKEEITNYLQAEFPDDNVEIHVEI